MRTIAIVTAAALALSVPAVAQSTLPGLPPPAPPVVLMPPAAPPAPVPSVVTPAAPLPGVTFHNGPVTYPGGSGVTPSYRLKANYGRCRKRPGHRCRTS